MSNFTTFISEDLTEAKTMKARANDLEEAINKLEEGKRIANTILKAAAKELGKGYIKDAETIVDKVNDCITILEDDIMEMSHA